MSGNNRSRRYSAEAVTEVSTEGQRLRAVEQAFASLPERYLGADHEFQASYRIELDDLGLSWAVELDETSCRVTVSPERDPDVVIGTDAETWLELREGRLSGLDAFRSRRLWARGNLDMAVAFEGFFLRPYGRPPLVRIHEVKAGRAKISTLTAGDGIETVILIHGLGSNKTSFFETVSALTPEFTVHAIDLPGFGSSSKPLRAPYDAAWFARSVCRFMDAMEIERAHLVGNSLGGRVALEVGLRAPGRVQSLSLLCPSMAWRRRRHFVPIVKFLRPELAAIPHSFGGPLVRQQFWSMFSRPERIHPSAADVAVEEFLRTYRSPNTRVAFSAAARNIYLEEPNGPRGFYTRLRELDPPAMFVWGDEDPLVPLAFSRYVADALPDARQVIIDQCGHVPQVEHPADANALVHDFIVRAQGSARERAAKRLSRAARRLQERINGNGRQNGAARGDDPEQIAAEAADAAA
jgi:pimeloyl-ACP methyl ester carboxylesterase/putative sterol carrier protein